jgi:hypothetical protein
MNPENATYCTMFDSGYMSRGLALICSMRSVGIDGDIWVLCLDGTSHQYLSRLKLTGVRLLTLPDVEAVTSGLRNIRAHRSRAEYFFTCTPALVSLVLDRATNADWVTYLDADTYFFSSPQHVFGEVEHGDVAIVPHRFPDRLAQLTQYGTYNVAWVMFRSSPSGRECAAWWRERCLEWCFDRPEDGLYADQGYLNDFAEHFPTTVVIRDSGLNVAPWNLGRHTVSLVDDHLAVDGSPLVFYHFHGLRKRGDWIYPSLATYKTRLTPTVRDRVYAPYISALTAIERGMAVINFGHPIPQIPTAPGVRNQRSLRSAAYRGRRRIVQTAERISGNAFRIADYDEGMQSREYN